VVDAAWDRRWRHGCRCLFLANRRHSGGCRALQISRPLKLGCAPNPGTTHVGLPRCNPCGRHRRPDSRRQAPRNQPKIIVPRSGQWAC